MGPARTTHGQAWPRRVPREKPRGGCLFNVSYPVDDPGDLLTPGSKAVERFGRLLRNSDMPDDAMFLQDGKALVKHLGGQTLD